MSYVKVNDLNSQIEACRKSMMIPQWFTNILWINEANYYCLHWIVNIHDCRSWAKKNPHAKTEGPYNNHILCFAASIIVGTFLFVQNLVRRPAQLLEHTTWKFYRTKWYCTYWNITSLTEGHSCNSCFLYQNRSENVTEKSDYLSVTVEMNGLRRSLVLIMHFSSWLSDLWQVQTIQQ